MTKKIMVPVSMGEVADKMSILDIKRRKIFDSIALNNIDSERKALELACKEHNIDFGVFLDELTVVNESLWDILQKQRDKESAGELDSEFIELSFSVYRLNDKRFDIKKKINEAFESDLIEEKFYK